MLNRIFLIFHLVVVSYFKSLLFFLLCVLWQTRHISHDFGLHYSHYWVAAIAVWLSQQLLTQFRDKPVDVFKSAPYQFYWWYYYQSAVLMVSLPILVYIFSNKAQEKRCDSCNNPGLYFKQWFKNSLFIFNWLRRFWHFRKVQTILYWMRV